MTNQDESVTTWLAGVKAGQSEPAEKVWNRYVERLVRLARRKLRGSPRRVADEEDVVLSAFNRFLQGVDDGRFLRLDNRDDLWQVLVMLTDRRAIAQRRREKALKRGGGKVRGESIYDGVQEPDGSQTPGLEREVGPEATPDFAAELSEELGLLLDQLSDEVQRQIAVGKLEGRTNQELAEGLGLSLRSVERKLSIIRDKWRDAAPGEC